MGKKKAVIVQIDESQPETAISRECPVCHGKLIVTLAGLNAHIDGKHSKKRGK